MMTNREWIDELTVQFQTRRNVSNAEAMSKYMRNQFEFYGIRSVERRSLSQPLMLKAKNMSAADTIKAVRELWGHPMREMQYVGMELLYRQRKVDGVLTPSFIAHIITHKSWWDTVDFIAANITGWAFKAGIVDTTNIMDWNQSEDIWLIRTSILFQLKYRNELDWGLLTALIQPHNGHSDFFVRKAIGWALRQHSYTDPLRVMDFVTVTSMAPLSKREALKALTGKSKIAKK